MRYPGYNKPDRSTLRGHCGAHLDPNMFGCNSIARTAVLYLGLLSLLVQQVVGAQRSNVLVVIVDDLRQMRDHVDVITPHMDAFFAEAAVMTEAHCDAPHCGASRTALLTGRPPHESGAYGFVDHTKLHSFDHASTIPGYFKANGFDSYLAGKVFHNKSFRVRSSDCTKVLCDQSHRGFENGKKGHDASAPGSGDRWGPSTGIPIERWDDFETVRIFLEMLSNRTTNGTTKPWFGMVGIYKPHLPLVAPKQFFDLYDPATLAVPSVPVGDMDDVPTAAIVPSKYHDHRKLLVNGDMPGYYHAYLATVSYADHIFGHLMQGLDNSAFVNNTAVVFMSDHGFQLGEKNAVRKFSLHRESTRVPMAFRAARSSSRQLGRGNFSAPVANIDVFRTLADLAGLPAPSDQRIRGRSLVPLIEEGATPGAFDTNIPALTTNGRDNYGLAFETMKYNRFFDGSEEVYNISADPDCHTNLADAPDYQAWKTAATAYFPASSHRNLCIRGGSCGKIFCTDYPSGLTPAWRRQLDDFFDGGGGQPPNLLASSPNTCDISPRPAPELSAAPVPAAQPTFLILVLVGALYVLGH